jgi:hypothetical protein
MTIAVPAPYLAPSQEPFVIAAGAIRPCEVPIRTVATSVSELLFPDPPPISGGDVFLLHVIAAIKLKPVKAHK